EAMHDPMMKATKCAILSAGLLWGAMLTARADDDPQLLFERAHYLSQTGKVVEAIELYRRILDEETDVHPEIRMQSRFRLGLTLLKSGQEDEARETMARLVDRLPTPDSLAEAPATFSWEKTLASIEAASLKPVDRDFLTEAMLRGVAESLGGRADYLPPRHLENMVVGLDRKLVGIGAILGKDLEETRALVKGVIPGAPAAEAGLVEGDRIARVDGQPIEAFEDLNALVFAIRGEAGTDVRLSVEREGGEIDAMVITRRAIELEPDELLSPVGDEVNFMVHDSIGAFRLSTFSRGVAEVLHLTLERLIGEGGLKACILDLRGNGGGSLQEAVAVADLFVGQKVVLMQESKKEGRVEVVGERAAVYPDLPLAVLIDAGTASAAEIVASCFQDHERAVILGSRSFGKGTVETLLPIGERNGALKISVAKLLTASGRSIGAETEEEDGGILPDEGFAFPRNLGAEGDGGDDRVLDRAIDHLLVTLES
ncbi:MAG: S41 family peptidase, partial [Verrucomicrobiota bacterium]